MELRPPVDAQKVPAPARHQRVDGAACIHFGRDGLTHLYQRAPARMLFPEVEPGEPIQAVAITTSGGLTGGDRLLTEIDVDLGAAATITTQAAERLYRVLAEDEAIRIETRIRVGEGAWGEWLAQEAILFDGTRARRSLDAEVAPTGRLLAVESLVFGRSAMGETVRRGSIHDVWRIRRGGRLVWIDALHLEGDVAAAMAEPFGFGAALSHGTILYVGQDAADHLDRVRALIGDGPGGATSFDGLLIVRLLNEDPAALRATMMRLVAALRAAAGGYAASLPRPWYC